MRTHGLSLILTGLLAACGGGGGDDDDDADAGQQPDAQTGADAPGNIDAAPAADAGPTVDGTGTDAGTCSGTGDYVEQDDAGNDAFHGGSIEPSGLDFDGTTITGTLGGCIDPQFADATDPPVADADFFQITVTGDRWISGRITSADTASDGGIAAIFDDQGNFVTSGTLAGGSGSIMPAFLVEGVYLVAAVHQDTALAAPYSYQVLIESLVCVNPGGPPAYRELNDGNLNRDNDMFGVVYSPMFTMTPTPAPTDVPEPSALTFMAGDVRRVRGVSADVAVPSGSEYLDHDTYAFTTGADVTRLVVLAGWADTANDIDVIIIPEDMIDPDAIVGYGGAIDGVRERVGALVQPNTTYWIWAANYMGSTVPMNGLGYNLNICAFE